MSAFAAIKDRLKQMEDLANAQEIDLSEIHIGRFTEEIKKHLEKNKKVTIFILRDCQLEGLENLPNWKLNAIDLSDNKLKDNAIPILANIGTLGQVILANNQIENVDSLKPLSNLKELTEVDFTGNPVSSKANYRNWLFENISGLEIVDNVDKQGNAVQQQEEFQEGSDGDEEEWDDDNDDEEEYEEASESSSDKPKKKKK